MDDILLHPRTRQQLERFVQSPSHSLILIAADGSGKRSVAEAIIRELLILHDDTPLNQHPAVVVIEPKDRTISIEAIRGLQESLRLKTIGQAPLRRAVLLEAAHHMTIEAQNSLLKILEEPPSDTLIILTISSAQSVLPTIYSRAQHIELIAPEAAEVKSYFKSMGHSDKQLTTALNYGDGRIGLTDALLKQDDTHSLHEAVSGARELLQLPLFAKLQRIEEWLKSKDELPERLEVLLRICQKGLKQAAEKGNDDLLKRWRNYYEVVYETSKNLKHNPNLKLLLTNLFLGLS